MDKTVERLLCETAPSRVADAAQKLAGDALADIEASLPRALAGDREQVRIYVDAYGRLTDRMLEAVGGACPDLIAAGNHRRTMVYHQVKAKTETTTYDQVKGARASGPEGMYLMKAVLQGEAMNAPFTDWVGSLDCGRGTAVAIVAVLRSSIHAGKPLSRPARWCLPDWELGEGDVVRFYGAVAAALAGAEHPLERIRSLFGLNRTEAAALFGVRRQALEGWERGGVPSERRSKLALVGAIADLLAAQLKSDRIPAVVRRDAPAYGGRSVLGAIAAGEEEAVLEALRAGFDWSSAV